MSLTPALRSERGRWIYELRPAWSTELVHDSQGNTISRNRKEKQIIGMACSFCLNKLH